MKRAFWLVALLVTLAALAYLELRPPTVRVNLLELLPQASTGPLLVPRGSLGDYHSSTFLGKGWGPITGNPARTAEGNAEVLFVQTQPTPVKVELEGRRDGSPGEVDQRVIFSVNSHSPQSFSLGKDWKRFRFQLPASELTEGLNHLWILAQEKTRWRDCQIRPLYANFHAPSALVGPDRLCLYYGTAKEFPVLLLPSTELTIEDLKPWDQPAAPPSTGWELTVRVQSGQAHLDKTWHLTAGGRQTLRLPVDVPTQVSLSLMATISQEPQSGQPGLCLVQPRLDSWSLPPQAPASPSIAPIAPTGVSVDPKPGPKPTKPNPPNVVLYLIDTLRPDHLHCYGYPKPISPHVDALAQDGVRFLDCQAASCWTKPSIASIMTSLSPHHHGAEDYADKLALPGTQKTLAQLLSETGYEARGWVANPMVGPQFGFDQGFSSLQMRPKATASELVAAALPWIKSRRQEQPFFLYLHALDAHLPYHVSGRFLPPGSDGNMSRRDVFELYRDWHKDRRDPKVQRRLEQTLALYDAGVAECDDAFGKLIQMLKSRGLYDNTIIVVVSDHGEEFFEHEGLGHLRTLYQEVMQVPLIVKFPHNLAAGTLIKPAWQTIDVAPTLLRQAGLAVSSFMEGKAYIPDVPSTPGQTGVSPPSVPPIGGQTERAAYFSINAGETAELFGQGVAMRRCHINGVRVGRWVLNLAYSSQISVYEPEPIELYDLQSDPGEHQNLAYSRPEVRVALASLLKLQRKRSVRATAPVVSARETERSLRALQYLR